MKRFCYLVWYLAVLTTMNPPAHAGSSFTFVVGGHRIHVEAPRHCNSPSCVSVSIPGVYETLRRWDDDRDRTDDTVARSDTAPAKPSVPAIEPAASRPNVSPGCPAVAPVASAPPPVVAQVVPAPRPAAAPIPAMDSVATATIPAPSRLPPVSAPVERPAIAAPPAPKAPPISRVSHEVDDESQPTPIGDWQTEGKTGSVRIQPCGNALCGYLLDASSNTIGESVLINMKPKAEAEWSGNVYSRSSGETYYGRLAMRGANALQVEACALGQFFCSGNRWTRIDVRPQRLITSRQAALAPKS
jgi:hypothetical protein